MRTLNARSTHHSEGLNAMYKSIVRSKVRATFRALSARDTGPFFASLGDPFHYRFAGDSTLSGERSTVASMQAWWKRVFTLIPDGRFEVGSITVNGMPWKTTVMTHVTVSATLADGTRYTNEFMQKLTLRMGKIIDVVTIEDTQRLAQAMAALEGLVPEATAAPIVDHVR
jgi:ketosteroid isomerase-like protein